MKGDLDLYLEREALLLADVFEKFRSTSIKNYGLCPSRYLGAPALSCDVIHYMTKVEFKLILDLDMHILF